MCAICWQREADGKVVGEACNGADAVRKAVSLRPDVAILDFSMPELNGPGAAAQIAEKVPETGVVVLTMHDSEQVMREVLQSGARGLVLKSDADRDLSGSGGGGGEEAAFLYDAVVGTGAGWIPGWTCGEG